MARMGKVGKIATHIGNADGYMYVQYHDTRVVKWNDDEIVLSSGGWHTNTTKTRMNQASNQFNLGYSVYQKDYAWYVSFNSKTYYFSDGMVLLRRAN